MATAVTEPQVPVAAAVTLAAGHHGSEDHVAEGGLGFEANVAATL